MRKLSAVLLVGARAVPTTLAAQDAPPPRPDRPMRLHAPDRMGPVGPGPREGVFNPQMLVNRRQWLELTEEQVKQMETLAAATREAHDKAATDAKPHEEKLAELWKADQPDAAAIQAEMKALMQVRQTASLANAANAAKAKGLLTAEQRGHVEGWLSARRMGGRDGGRGWGDAPRQGRGYRQVPPTRR